MPDSAVLSIETPRAQNATQRVFEALCSAIQTLELAPGAKISEIDTAKSLGVSRQPVRDAFFRLSELGLLSIRPQRATTISLISTEAVRNAHFIRTTLELECLRAAMERLSPSALAEIEGIVAEQANVVAHGDGTRFRVLDNRFHQTLCEIGGRGTIWDLICDQKVHLDRVRALNQNNNAPIKALREHRDILRCLRERRLSNAQAHLKKHLNRVLITLGQVQERHPQHFNTV